MLLRIQLFAAAKQLAGRDAVEIELVEGATVADLRRTLGLALPELSALLPQSVFAIGTEYAAENDILASTAEIACIPPVSGG